MSGTEKATNRSDSPSKLIRAVRPSRRNDSTTKPSVQHTNNTKAALQQTATRGQKGQGPNTTAAHSRPICERIAAAKTKIKMAPQSESFNRCVSGAMAQLPTTKTTTNTIQRNERGIPTKRNGGSSFG